jgi:hypothetical protein
MVKLEKVINIDLKILLAASLGYIFRQRIWSAWCRYYVQAVTFGAPKTSRSASQICTPYSNIWAIGY